MFERYSHTFFAFQAMVVFCLAGVLPGKTAAQPAALEAQSRYEEGKAWYNSGNYIAAQKAFFTSVEMRRQLLAADHPLLLKSIWHLANAEGKLRHNDAARALYLELLQSIGPKQDESTADLYVDLGNIYNQAYEPEKAKQAYTTALVLYAQHYGRESAKTGNVLMSIGTAYQKMGHYQDAEKSYLKAFEVFKKTSEPDSEDFNRIYSNLGYLYRKMGNLPKSLQFAEKAKEIKLKNYDPEHPSVAKYHRNIGRVYQEMDLAEKALPYFLRALEIEEKSLGRQHPETAGAMAELAGVYADMKAYPKALKLYRDALKLMLKTREKTHPYVVAGYVNIASVYAEINQPKAAIRYFEQALNLLEQRSYTAAGLQAQIEQQIAEVYHTQGDQDRALDWCQKALMHLSPALNMQGNKVYPKLDPTGIQDKVLFVKTLFTQTNAFERRAKAGSNQIENLKDALQTIQLAIQVVDVMRKTYLSDASRLYLRSETLQLYQSAVRISFILFQHTSEPAYFWKALEFVEQSQASVLRQSLQDAFALQTAGLPDSLVQRFETLGAQLAQLEITVLDGNEADLQNSQKLNALQLQHQAMVESLETDFPKYYALKYGALPFNAAQLQNKLPNSATAICYYFCDETQVFCFLVKKNEIAASVQPFGKAEVQAVLRIRNTDPLALLGLESTLAQAGYIESLNHLYEILISPFETKLMGISHLKLVTSSILQYLPFEVLAPTSGEKSFRHLPYLLRQHTIQYLWSASFWMNPNTVSRDQKLPLLGLAPGFFGNMEARNYAQNGLAKRNVLVGLPYAQVEIENANRYYNGKILIGAAATKRAFLEWAPQSAVLHLATHALVDDQHPLKSVLCFYGDTDSLDAELLYLSELYQLRLSAELVVLSACNSGFGQIADGEGVLSMGRGFRYAGAKSVLMNLWPANDRSTADLMAFFYQNLATGMPKDDALRQAKLAFLEKADPIMAHPFYWAGLVMVGDNAAITATKGGLPWAWLMLSIGLLGGAVFFYKFIQKGKM